MAANTADKLHRPFHSAFSQGLLPCPHQRYIDNCSFYTKDGLSHHSRCLHGKPKADDRKEAMKLIETKYKWAIPFFIHIPPIDEIF